MRRPVSRAVQLMIGISLAACATLPEQVGIAEEVKTVRDPGAAELEILEQVNAYRESRELPRLKHDPLIADVARTHSQAMLRGEAPFSHAGLTERGEEIAQSVPFMHIAENIYTMQPASSFTPWRIVAGWLRSDPHRVEIEGCFDTTGVGIAMNDEEVYVTQIFVLSRPRMQHGVRHSTHPCR